VRSGAVASRILGRTAAGVTFITALAVNVTSATIPGGIIRAGFGFDHATYMDAATRWLAGGGFYHAYQLAGPYEVVAREVLYPPTILPLLAAFHFLPDFLWWAIPTAIVIGVIAYWRPSAWGWAGIFGCLTLPQTLNIWSTGNPGIWVAAGVALATIWRWPAVLVLFKPTLLPFALVGVRSRSWWIAAGAFGLVSLAFLPLWGDYVTVLLNARGPRVGWWYSLGDVPLVAIPLIAWAGRSRTPCAPASGTR
jgi:hypothetical protein